MFFSVEPSKGAAMDWITENIAIGNFIDAQNASADDLDAIICLKPDCCDEVKEIWNDFSQSQKALP